MISSFPDYHKEFNLTRPLANAFLAMSHDALWEDIQIISDLCAVVKDRGPDISYLDWYLEQAVGEWERRRERYERYSGDTFPPAWPDSTYYEEMRAQADDLKAHVSIERYLAQQAPHTEMKRIGSRIRALCPFPDHHEDTASFVIFDDGHAWCFGCQRGGDLFRVIGLMEGLPRFRDQIRRAAEFVPGAGETIPENRSFPTVSHREMGRKERSGRGNSYQPIRIVNGRVSP